MTNNVYINRRKKLLEMMDDGIAIIASATYAHKSNDTEFPFRQNSNFRYLTGLNEADSALILSKKNGVEKQIIFVRPKDEIAEMWAGKRLGPIKASELLGTDEGHSIEELDKKLEELLPGHKNLYVHLSERTDIADKARRIASSLFHKKRAQQELPPDTFKNVGHLIEKMRFIKDETEIATMREAMIVTDRAHRAAMALARPGATEQEVNALMTYLFMKGPSQGSAYDNIIAGGNNANCLHYIKNDEVLNDGDLLLIDAGSELNGYATDITRTFPVSGKYTGIQKEVYNIVLESQLAAIELSKPGNNATMLHNKVSEILTQGLIDLKVLEGSVSSNIEQANHRKYFPHGTGHWLGLDVHDQNPYLIEGTKDPMTFTKGCIFTIEPGLYFNNEFSNIPEELKGIGIRIEDNILITDDGYENLSHMIPKTVEEVEEACAKDVKEFLL
ncbi:metallopeptidase family M24 [Bacteriovorax sp. BAL6_X]|uniref:aminopeptidase P N-terminal domain-containing protein n=1 Tax=Bacteriovorax sp. BAL6_X TaxID=1201290 RepID=UPI000386E2A1|nr:aminopeptidase P N-terminal domain-containing protein [Bacteriovorax sp. BAL6_X]EPZ51361.1 metallopeptidase family M24 [Bacteriovorax sp. BAL6_X]